MSTRQRYIELDLLRTVAILGMIIYHTAYDLQSFYGWDIGVFNGGWKIFQVAIASLFLLLVGITSSFSTKHPWKRCMGIGAAALLVSVVTFLIDPETYVRFGILHLIATAAVLLPMITWTYGCVCHPEPVEGRTSLSQSIMMLILGIAFITAGPWIALQRAQHAVPLLLPLGIPPKNFVTVDYYPLIPWFGVVLIGFAAAPWLLQKMHTAEPMIASWPGRHSLVMYLIHQPLIIGILWLMLGKPTF
jgi:uncharacterized membrane protein